MKQNNSNNQEIGCKVYDCEFNNYNCDCCNLKKIEICNCSNELKKEATMCNSYKKKQN